VTAPQASVATAPPCDASQAFSSATLPAPSHATVRGLAGVVIVGGVVSTTVIVAEQVLLPPWPSVTVTVTEQLVPHAPASVTVGFALAGLSKLTPGQSDVQA